MAKIVRFFLTTISHMYRTIKPPWWAAMKKKILAEFQI